MDPALFARDQPTNAGLVEWDGGIVVRTATPRRIDLTAGRSSALSLPGSPQILDLATHEGPVALCKGPAGLHLVAKSGSSWTTRDVPEEIRGAAGAVRLAADSTSLVLLGEHVLHRLRSGRWSRLDVPEPPLSGGVRGGPNHLALIGEILFAGWDRGEWGGALLSLDLGTGRWSRVGTPERRGYELPVRDMTLDPSGKLWVARGLAHLGLRQGEIASLEGASFRTLAAVDQSEPAQTVAWTLPADAFDAVAFGPQGHLHVLTGSLGVVRRDGAAWTRMTPSWPSGGYVYVQDLLVTGNLAVIDTYDAGVLLWDLGSGSVRRVALAP